MVFGLFSKEKSLQKTIERATNKLAQAVDRQGALDKLKEVGTEEALYGLCKRFGVTSMKAVEDEHEKHWTVDALVSHGAAALAPLARYMKSAEQLAFPLKVLERIADHDKVLAIADELFATEVPGYVRMPDRRVDLIHWFADWKPATEDEYITRVAPYVTDFDENVRFVAIEGMAGRNPEKIAPVLINALLRPEEESGRIKRTILEVLEKSKAPLGERAKDVAAALSGPLASDFKVDGGLIKKR